MKRYSGKRRRGAAAIVLKTAVWIGILAAVVWVVMALWNWLMPALFAGARSIDYWQALGLLALCKILFGGGHGRWHGHRRHHRWHRNWHRQRDLQQQMSDAEREALAQRLQRADGASGPHP